jgi:hypothetical protein
VAVQGGANDFDGCSIYKVIDEEGKRNQLKSSMWRLSVEKIDVVIEMENNRRAVC